MQLLRRLAAPQAGRRISARRRPAAPSVAAREPHGPAHCRTALHGQCQRMLTSAHAGQRGQLLRQRRGWGLPQSKGAGCGRRRARLPHSPCPPTAATTRRGWRPCAAARSPGARHRLTWCCDDEQVAGCVRCLWCCCASVCATCATDASCCLQTAVVWAALVKSRNCYPANAPIFKLQQASLRGTVSR